jgi:3'-phosphoadenosine 5'-phosphosulfate sulfotransferase (PAPS reductase)/FAD synthetase
MLGTSGDPVAALTEQHPKTLEFLYTDVCKKNKVMFMHSSNMEKFIHDSGLKCQVDGARRSEWDRPGKSSNIIVNGKNVNRKDMPDFVEVGIFGMSLVYPILDWVDEDVFDYLDLHNLPFSDEYRENGELENWRSLK